MINAFRNISSIITETRLHVIIDQTKKLETNNKETKNMLKSCEIANKDILNKNYNMGMRFSSLNCQL